MAPIGLSNGKSKVAAWDLNSADDPADWSSSFRFLQPLDASLRCELCYDIFKAPVAIKECGHTFCSQCIRTYINQAAPAGQQCAKCRAKAVFDSSLQPQPALEAAAVAWRKARVHLVTKQEEEALRDEADLAETASSSRGTKRKASKQRVGDDADSDASIIISSSPIAERRGARVTRASSSKGGGSNSPVVIDEDSQDEDFFDDTLCRPKEPPQKRAKHNEQKETVDYRNLSGDEIQTCPICSHDFTARALDKHLNRGGCSPDDTAPSAAERGFSDRTPGTSSKSNGWFRKPGNNAPASNNGPAASSRATSKKLVRAQYGVMKEKELIKLLQEASLPSTGGRQRLIERHRQWVNLFNANLDASEAQRKSAWALKRDLAEWDRGMDAADKAKAKGGELSAGKAKGWARKNVDHFRELTQSARATNEKNKKAHAKPQEERQEHNEKQELGMDNGADPSTRADNGAGSSRVDDGTCPSSEDDGAGPSRAINDAKAQVSGDSQDYFAQLDDGQDDVQEALMLLGGE